MTECPQCGEHYPRRIGGKTRCDDCGVRWTVSSGLAHDHDWREWPIETGV